MKGHFMLMAARDLDLRETRHFAACWANTVVTVSCLTAGCSVGAEERWRQAALKAVHL